MKNSRLPALCLGLLFTWATPAFSAEQQDGSTRIVVEGSTLEDFFVAAMDYSPRLRIAEERWSIGTARKQQATGQLLPQLNANGTISDNTQELQNNTNQYRGERYSLQLTQVLFNWQAFSARSAAALLEDQAEAEYFAELAWLLTDVAEKYFEVLQADDAVTSIQTELNAVNNQLAQVQSLYNLQAAQITDLYAAQARQAAVQSEQLELESILALARERLRSITGVNVGELFRLDENVAVPPVTEAVTVWLDRARENNQQIIAREYAVEAAHKRVSQQRGTYMPRVSLIAQQQLSDLGYDNARLPSRTDTTYVGIDVSIPLFAGGANRASVSEASSMRNIAQNELRQVQLEIVERTRTAYLQVKSAELRIQAAERLAASTELSLTAMQRGFELGTVTSVDVLNALRDRFNAERDLHRARYELIKFNLLLKREAGTLSADDLMDVGSWLVPPEA
ncbi:MAG: TolC family outer membrane protein [Gammaproteobacteria bacterium]|nr:TolC family outer membrane protein [Gammaproteobacteria bacterium]MDP2139729.1 TolC family outer membrane protein [Gammaproteobacteria bacterium]MDP2348932.1 TolC family outer membrane protein [Gammaproteobacteria bacterium]